MASIQKIEEISAIPAADKICAYRIGGWWVVGKVDEFNVGDLCVYLEIDSFLPDGNPAWQHLVEKHPRMFEGARGHRLKTVRLRGQLSQGFAAPVTRELETEWSHTFLNFEGARNLQVGDDLSELLGIKKWEAVIPSELAGQVRGNFPGFIPKTDQERCQNLGVDIFVTNTDSRYEVTMKMDGTSFTAYYRDDVDGVCGRNWELQVNGDNASNTLVRMFVDSGLQAALRELRLNYAVQGELQGPGVQGNKEEFKTHILMIFDIYDIDNLRYLTPNERHNTIVALWNCGLNRDMVQHVPVLSMATSLSELGIFNMSELLQFAKGPSVNAKMREGLVFKRVDGLFSFKAINNDWLLKNE